MCHGAPGYIIVVLWFSKVHAWVLYPECGIMVFWGRSLRNSIIPHKEYNPYILENHSTADLYYAVVSYTLGCMRFLEYMGFHHSTRLAVVYIQ